MTPFPRMPASIIPALDIAVRPTATAALPVQITVQYNNKKGLLLDMQNAMHHAVMPHITARSSENP